MANDNTPAPRERQRLNFQDASDLRAWCKEFDVPPHLVKNTTLQNGVMIVDVRAQLERLGGWFKSTKE